MTCVFLSGDIWTPLTVLATRETLYLLREDHQWRKSSDSLTVNDNEEPSSGGVVVLETLPISCVSSVHLWPPDQCRVDIKLYDEVSTRHVLMSIVSLSCELLNQTNKIRYLQSLVLIPATCCTSQS